MGMLMTIMSNFSVLRFIDSFYSCIATCLWQVNIPQMFDKWKPLFRFLSEMIFVTFQNTFIAQMSTCFEGKQTRLTNNLSRFNYEGAVVLWERECTYICCWRTYNISILSAMDIWWNFNSTKYVQSIYNYTKLIYLYRQQYMNAHIYPEYKSVKKENVSRTNTVSSSKTNKKKCISSV